MYIYSPGIESMQGQDISLFFKTSILALEPTQWGFFPEIQQMECEVNPSLSPGAEVRMSEVVPLCLLCNFKMWTGTT